VPTGARKSGGGTLPPLDRARIHTPIAKTHAHRGRPAALDENLETIRAWERAFLQRRTMSERVGDWLNNWVATGTSLILHAAWFGSWILINLGAVPFITPFDPYPFELLTMTVSLEAIFLSLFVLISQNRLSRQTDKRALLDLQIDLLVEREMTGVLELVEALAKHLKVNVADIRELRTLAEKTDIKSLVEQLDKPQ
jgi:uncharacterized membrane protein